VVKRSNRFGGKKGAEKGRPCGKKFGFHSNVKGASERVCGGDTCGCPGSGRGERLVVQPRGVKGKQRANRLS